MHLMLNYLPKRCNGFTLIELVVVMTVTGILASGAALFIGNPTHAYFDNVTYANLTDRADTVLRRMRREIRNALPNSVRLTTNSAGTFVEFIPVKTAGRYRANIGLGGADNPLDFSLGADTFDVLGPAVNITAGDKLVIYNLGISGADAYEGTNIRPLLTTGNLTLLSFNGGAFPLAAPSSRFHIVSTATTFACDMANQRLLMYSGYNIQQTQPTSIATLNSLATPRVLVEHLSACQIQYLPGALQRTAVIAIYFGLKQEQANIHLMHQVNLVNSP